MVMQSSIFTRQGVDTRRPHVTCLSVTRQAVVPRPVSLSSSPVLLSSKKSIKRNIGDDCVVRALGGTCNPVHMERHVSLQPDLSCICCVGPGDRKGLTREDEPEEYWSSERERKGESPFKDPVALIGILAILFPFVLLLILSAAGVVDLTPQ